MGLAQFLSEISGVELREGGPYTECPGHAGRPAWAGRCADQKIGGPRGPSPPNLALPQPGAALREVIPSAVEGSTVFPPRQIPLASPSR